MISNPIAWIFENLESYMFGTKLLMGLAVLIALIYGMFLMRISPMIMAILMIPLIIALTVGGYLPVSIALFVVFGIIVLWIMFFKIIRGD
jgi:hypothetical protein